MPKITPRACTISLDTTFFGDLGVSVARDITNKQNLIWVFTQTEKQAPYTYMYKKLIKEGVSILGIVVDGRNSFYTSFNNTPIQMCHFHMAQILRRYLTKKPNLEVNKELWNIWYKIEQLNTKQLQKTLFKWFCKYSNQLTETYTDQDNNIKYIKERTLNAYKSLRRYSSYLFTYKASKWIPNTNNSIEGMFSQMKKKINIHNGLTLTRKMKVIHFYLINNNPK